RLALPQRAQVILEAVREVLGGAQLDHPGDALERVEVPEQLVERVAVDLRPADRTLEGEQQPPHAHQVVVALGEVVVEEIGERVAVVDRHGRLIRAARPRYRPAGCGRTRGAPAARKAW